MASPEGKVVFRLKLPDIDSGEWYDEPQLRRELLILAYNSEEIADNLEYNFLGQMGKSLTRSQVLNCLESTDLPPEFKGVISLERVVELYGSYDHDIPPVLRSTFPPIKGRTDKSA